MSDDDLIARLRTLATNMFQSGNWGNDLDTTRAAADRIEALVNAAALSKAAYDGVSSLLLSVQQDCIKERQRAERLEAALEKMKAEQCAACRAYREIEDRTALTTENRHE